MLTAAWRLEKAGRDDGSFSKGERRSRTGGRASRAEAGQAWGIITAETRPLPSPSQVMRIRLRRFTDCEVGAQYPEKRQPSGGRGQVCFRRGKTA